MSVDPFGIDAPEGTLPELWPGDTGILSEATRRVLLKLLQGPFISSQKDPKEWPQLLADTAAITSRLHDLFLDLVIDRVEEVAFIRPVGSSENVFPVAVRTLSLTFMDTLLLLVLRQFLLSSQGAGPVYLDKSEVVEQLQAFRGERDPVDFAKRVNASWTKFGRDLRLLVKTDEKDRVEISPAVRVLIDADRVKTITAQYRKLAEMDRGASFGE